MSRSKDEPIRYGTTRDAGPTDDPTPAARTTRRSTLPVWVPPLWPLLWALLVWALIGVTVFAAMAILPLSAQEPVADPPPPVVPPLFSSDDLLDVTITADFEALRGDRRESPDRPGTLSVTSEEGGSRDVGIELRTRGQFRLDPRNCSFPPLRLDVDRSDAVGTVFEDQDDLKLVSACRPGRGSYEQMVLLEYAAYRIYALLTDESFRVRLLDVTFVDVNGAAQPERRKAFVIEEAEALAERLGATLFELGENQNLPPSAFEPVAATTNAVFQYMIGNTDWSDVAGHNVEILERAGVAKVVPYDFDFSGLVDAPYAAPAPDLGLREVTERAYRGWCANPFTVRTVLDRFRAAQAEVPRLLSDVPGLEEGTRVRAERYLAGFFDAIDTDERAERRFLRDCRRVEG